MCIVFGAFVVMFLVWACWESNRPKSRRQQHGNNRSHSVDVINGQQPAYAETIQVAFADPNIGAQTDDARLPVAKQVVRI
jgi:hypothetical protein